MIILYLGGQVEQAISGCILPPYKARSLSFSLLLTYQTNGDWQQAGTAIPIFDKVDF